VNYLPFAAQFTVLAIFLHISADLIYFSMLRHRIGALRHHLNKHFIGLLRSYRAGSAAVL